MINSDKHTILLVDDSSHVLDDLADILVKYGYTSITATSGKQALNQISSHKIDLILLDIFMPGMDGYDTCKNVKANILTKEIPVIFISDLDDSVEKVKAFKAGGADYITKPVEAEELIIRIENQLRANRLQKGLKEANETLEEKIRTRTLELTKVNIQLEKEIQQRIMAEKKLMDSYNTLQRINNALARSEEKFRNFFNSTKDSLTLINYNNHNFIDVNEAFLELSGYTKEEIFAKKTYDFFVMRSQEKHSEMKQKYAEIERMPYYEVELITKTGNLVPIEMTSRIAPFHGTQVLISVIRDVTERKAVERRLLHAVIVAEERERSRFSSELHDGLGPMLSTIKLYFQWLAETHEETNRQEIIDKGNQNIEEAIQSLREISNNLSPRTLNNHGIVVAIRNFVQGLNETKKLSIDFETNVETRFDKNVEITLYRVTTELLNNTIKYARATKANISLNINEEDQKLLLKYSDNGHGFDLNDKFAERKGLGLTNIIQRVNSLNGKVNLQSSEGKGIFVEIELYLKDE